MLYEIRTIDKNSTINGKDDYVSAKHTRQIKHITKVKVFPQLFESRQGKLKRFQSPNKKTS